MTNSDWDFSQWGGTTPSAAPRHLPPAAEAAIGIGGGCLLLVLLEAVVLAVLIHVSLHAPIRGVASRSRGAKPANSAPAHSKPISPPRPGAGG